MTKKRLSVDQGCIRMKMKIIPLTAPDAPILEKAGLWLCLMAVGILARMILSRYSTRKITRPSTLPKAVTMYISIYSPKL